MNTGLKAIQTQASPCTLSSCSITGTLPDFGDQHEFDVRLIETRPTASSHDYPHIVEQHGKMPPHASRPDWDDESEEEDDGGGGRASAPINQSTDTREFLID